MFAFNYRSSAETWKYTKGIGLSSSIIKFEGDQIDRAALGNWSGLTIRYGITSHLMVDFNAAYGSFKPNEEGKKYKKDSNSPYRTFLFPLSLALKITPVKEGKFKPYITMGLGLLIWDLRNVSGTDVTFWQDKKFRWGDRVKGALEKNLNFNQGIGFEYYFRENLSLDIQGRFTSLLDIRYDNVGLNDLNDQVFEGKATISYYFDYYKDTDKDGIEDRFDADPNRAEDFDGYQDKDGAPDYDNDRDGIPDIQDRAPNEKEDIDGFEDSDGIPDHDNDGDGIMDIADTCPNEPEDKDGYQDEDGCPDYDNDGDSIPDTVDKCPDKREIMNGFEDEDGCPDERPSEILVSKGSSLLLSGVNFNSGSANLSRESFNELNVIIDILKKQPDIVIEIRGYTDSIGKASTNQRLSENRAEAVRQYFVRSGIESMRLRVVGYGEKDPVASNKTSEGRAKNRRIEMILRKVYYGS